MYPPGGDHRRPPFFGQANGGRISLCGRTLGVCTLKKIGLLSLFSVFGIFGIFDIFAIGDFRRNVLENLLGRNLFPKSQKIVEIQSWRLPNRVLEPQKSSREAFETPFLKDM